LSGGTTLTVSSNAYLLMYFFVQVGGRWRVEGDRGWGVDFPCFATAGLSSSLLIQYPLLFLLVKRRQH
jgi:hypothetical protein